ncbi:MAG: DUF4422 domain-containing protein [Pseudobutyrivibrio sp.]|nr:DUF4422 domain-containing protein [Pseudobutyrivibrio sp.]
MNIKIFTITHKKFDIPTDSTYIPLQVGAATHEHLGYLTDDTGDNISHLNCYYSELTGAYWVWKNVTDADIVGICHYRRFLLNDQELIFTAGEIGKLLETYDILTSKSLDLNFTYYYGFGENHSRDDLDKTMEVIRDMYPDFYPLFYKRINECHTYFGNIMYCRKALFDEYCSFLFPIFEELHKHLNLDSYDDYHRRLYGFISEFILFVWCEYKGLKVKECKVGFVGEKTETREVKLELDRLLKLGDITGAKSYFLQVHKNRPDILMEASDITWELHLILEIISISEFELLNLGQIMAPINLPFAEMIAWIRALNKSITNNTAICDEHTSEYAIYVARKLYGKQ